MYPQVKEYFSWDQCKTAYKAIFVIAVCLFIYSQVLNASYGDDRAENDLLNINYIDGEDEKHSGWTISHFLMYFALGMIAPQCMRGVLTVGIIFEVLESMMGVFSRCTSPKKKEIIGERDYGRSWWKGTTKDIIVNTLGFICGAILSILFLGM